MYLVRTIQARESAVFLDQLGSNHKAFLPLPSVPRREFDRVAIIHAGRVLGFELDRVEPCDEEVEVGSKADEVIHAKVKVFVKQKPPREGIARIRGFQGIRYKASWFEIAER